VRQALVGSLDALQCGGDLRRVYVACEPAVGLAEALWVGLAVGAVPLGRVSTGATDVPAPLQPAATARSASPRNARIRIVMSTLVATRVAVVATAVRTGRHHDAASRRAKGVYPLSEAERPLIERVSFGLGHDARRPLTRYS